MRILKEYLQITDAQNINLPGSNVNPISVIEQNKKLVMYFETDYDSDCSVPVTVYVIGTGHIRSDLATAKYIGTVAMTNGFVWHVYFSK